MSAFKLYDVNGAKRPLRLSPEHAKSIGATEAKDQQVSTPAPVQAQTQVAVADEPEKKSGK